MVRDPHVPSDTLTADLGHLLEASKAVVAVLETDRLLEVILDSAIGLARADRGFVLLADGYGGLTFRRGLNAERQAVGEQEAVLSRSVADEVFRTGAPILSSNALGDDTLSRRKSVLDLRLRTVMCAQLQARGRVLGVLYVDSGRLRGAFEASSLAVFQALADLAAIALENARLFELATTDAKTGLSNAGAFRARLEEAMTDSRRSGRAIGLVLIDLDHFKTVNDTYGHPAGDVVLQVLATILKRSLRAGDVAARYGGEEFALVLAPPVEGTLDALGVAERVRRAIAARAFVLPDGTGIRVTASLGVATFPAEGIEEPDDLIAAADAALYEAKHAGRNRVSEARALTPA